MRRLFWPLHLHLVLGARQPVKHLERQASRDARVKHLPIGSTSHSAPQVVSTVSVVSAIAVVCVVVSAVAMVPVVDGGFVPVVAHHRHVVDECGQRQPAEGLVEHVVDALIVHRRAVGQEAIDRVDCRHGIGGTWVIGLDGPWTSESFASGGHPRAVRESLA